jgi:hypothetical protein
VRYLAREFVLVNDDNFTPAGAIQTVGVPAGLDATESVNGNWVAHNGDVFSQSNAVLDTGSLDATVYHNRFSRGNITVATLAGNTEADAAGITATLITADDLYGADHGLTMTLGFYLEAGFDGAAGAGTSTPARQTDADLYAVSVDNATGAVAFAEIDPFVTESASPETAPVTALQTRMARDGTYVAAGFIQQEDDATAGDANDNDAVKVFVYDTSRLVNAAVAPFSATVILNDSNNGVNVANVTAYEFQEELEYLCGIQTLVNTMNILFLQATAVAADPDTVLHTARFTVALSTTAAPVVTDAGDLVVVAVDTDWGAPQIPDLNNAVAYDRGDALANVNVLVLAQANNLGEPVAGSFAEPRWQHYVGTTLSGQTLVAAGTGVISTEGTNDEQLGTGGFNGIVTTPHPT